MQLMCQHLVKILTKLMDIRPIIGDKQLHHGAMVILSNE